MSFDNLTCRDLRVENRAGTGAALRASTSTVSPNARTSFLFHTGRDVRAGTLYHDLSESGEAAGVHT